MSITMRGVAFRSVFEPMGIKRPLLCRLSYRPQAPRPPQETVFLVVGAFEHFRSVSEQQNNDQPIPDIGGVKALRVTAKALSANLCQTRALS
jgi:hypothetical protein